MRQILRRTAAAFICLIFILGFASCSNEPENKPITSTWKYQSITDPNGRIEGTTSLDDPDKLPKFISEDGETFWMTITGANEYRGTIEEIGDGHYRLHHKGSDKTVEVKIDGDIMELGFPNGSILTFKAAD